MCGRYSETKDVAAVRERFRVTNAELELAPRYNIAPTQMAPVIVADGGRALRLMQWGLVPFWAKDASIGSKLINARAEGVAEKPSFRSAFKRQRCLVPADGFYEWRKTGAGKQPYRFTLKHGELFAFAGLWEKWAKPDAGELQTFTIITTDANEMVRPVHERMPVILKEEDYDRWLAPDFQDKEQLQALLRPYSAEAMSNYPVDPLVNSPRHDDPRCIEPVGDEPAPGMLF